jgi:hypothetical protein
MQAMRMTARKTECGRFFGRTERNARELEG